MDEGAPAERLAPGPTGVALFDTAIGRCAVVWRGDSMIGAALPEGSEAQIRARLARHFPEASEREPTPAMAAAIAAIIALLDGEKADLSAIAVDLDDAPGFERKVYAEGRAIPPGEVRTYGEIARAIGMPGAAQAVGRALGRNPVPIVIPCHRVLAGAGRSGGFYAPGGVSTKLRMLEIEGARRGAEPELFERLPWTVKPGRR